MNELEYTIENRIKSLLLTDTSSRLQAAHGLSDTFDYLLTNPGAISDSTYKDAIIALINISISVDHFETQEVVLSTLTDAAAVFTSNTIPWSKLLPLLQSPSIQIVEYILYILSFTHDPQFEQPIKVCCGHPSSSVQKIAKQSLQELLSDS